ncbi:MAG TPA: extracellular solute-binding protein, partial [Rectinemataceae bacterium]|nr:extracellular solute-binding protein [Rectinemataceae bacterium]
MKKTLALALVLAMSLALAVFAAPVTITHWYWADSPAFSQTMQKMAADFSATNGKGITVVAQEYPWDGGGYSEMLFRTAMGGGGPDTSSAKLTSTPLFTANKLWVDLEAQLGAWKDRNLINASLYDTIKGASGGKGIFLMPWNTQVLYVYYRPSMLKAAGLSVPKTYAEFLDACRKLTRDTNGDGKIDVYGFGMRGAKGGQEPWGSFIWARGGSFADLTSPKAVQGMQDYIDLYRNGYVPPTAPADGFNEIIANFKSGKTAMTVHHIGSSTSMIDTFGADVDAFAFPGDVGRWTSMGDTENVMLSGCKNRDAAFE